MKVSIITEIKQGPYGGGNQFLKALRKKLVESRLYTDKIKEADIILFNSFQNIFRAAWLKLLYPTKIFIHRVDGPIGLVRGSDEQIDRIVFLANKSFANGTIFQSRWSFDRSKELGMVINTPHIVVYNAPDASIFKPKARNPNTPRDRKIRIISTSWSDNKKKGFDYYDYLDKNLDFERYEMSFVGRSPVDFVNIKDLGPLDQSKLADLLFESDIYLTASADDPCSNALIEAISVGLPVVALDSGGNTELTLGGGEMFSHKEGMLEKIDTVSANPNIYFDKKPNYIMDDCVKIYVDFFSILLANTANKPSVFNRVGVIIAGLEMFGIHLRFKSLKLFSKLFRK